MLGDSRPITRIIRLMRDRRETPSVAEIVEAGFLCRCCFKYEWESKWGFGGGSLQRYLQGALYRCELKAVFSKLLHRFPSLKRCGGPCGQKLNYSQLCEAHRGDSQRFPSMAQIVRVLHRDKPRLSTCKAGDCGGEPQWRNSERISEKNKEEKAS